MRLQRWLGLLALSAAAGLAFHPPTTVVDEQQRLDVALPADVDRSTTAAPTRKISTKLFASLERLSRLVDITYCVGTTGVSYPFSCVSRCKEFPTLSLITTWNTGIMLSDSCGYIAVDHGKPRPGENDGGKGHGGERAIVVAFRGTYSITNTVVDLSTVPQEYVPYPTPGKGDDDGDDGDDDGGRKPIDESEHKCTNCTVHMGFLASWRAARKLVIPELKRMKALNPDYPVHLVGHSLGGAVAMLAALEIRVALGWKDVVVTTFGEPRVGNQGLVDYLDALYGLDGNGTDDKTPFDPDTQRYRRVTHMNDPVPLLPPSEMGFRPHAGELYIAKADLYPSLGDVRACRGDRDSSCSDGVDDNYIESLQRLLKRLLSAQVEAEFENADTKGSIRGWSLGLPSRLRLWQLFFAHRDYFWRLGLCVPGGDPSNWGRTKYPGGNDNEL